MKTYHRLDDVSMMVWFKWADQLPKNLVGGVLFSSNLRFLISHQPVA